MSVDHLMRLHPRPDGAAVHDESANLANIRATLERAVAFLRKGADFGAEGGLISVRYCDNERSYRIHVGDRCARCGFNETMLVEIFDGKREAPWKPDALSTEGVRGVVADVVEAVLREEMRHFTNGLPGVDAAVERVVAKIRELPGKTPAPATGPCPNCGAITRLPPASDGHFCGARRVGDFETRPECTCGDDPRMRCSNCPPERVSRG